ncbi:MAG: hypothetical protein SFY68_14910 [Candidatus Sumerlaeia bacterium]|nr:hypothetical protein [Candidatus Sumerlaeia bacterium]
MANYLKFKRSSRRCLLCDCSLDALEKHPTTLDLPKNADDAIRNDVCNACWNQMENKSYFSFWISKRFQEGPTPEQRRLAKAERNDALWKLFLILQQDRSAEDYAAQIFLVAHLLMKYRILQFQERQGDDLVFYHSPTAERYTVRDVPIDSVDFVEIKSRVDKGVMQVALETEALESEEKSSQESIEREP